MQWEWLDVHFVLLDNGSSPETATILDQLSHPRLHLERLPQNVGKGNACNRWISIHLGIDFNPKVVVSMDSDLLFSASDFKILIEATLAIPNVGALSMRYTPNRCNPERNLWLPARTYSGQDGQIYRIKHPLFCNVAGGILALPTSVICQDLNGILYPRALGHTYYPDDAYLYDALKKMGKVTGYLEGTQVTHLRSGEIYAYPDRDPYPWALN